MCRNWHLINLPVAAIGHILFLIRRCFISPKYPLSRLSLLFALTLKASALVPPPSPHRRIAVVNFGPEAWYCQCVDALRRQSRSLALGDRRLGNLRIQSGAIAPSLPRGPAPHTYPVSITSRGVSPAWPAQRAWKEGTPARGPAWTGEQRTASRLGPGALAPDTSGGTAEAYVNPGHRTVVVEPTRGPRADGAAPLVGLGSLTRAHRRIIPSVKRRGGGLPPPASGSRELGRLRLLARLGITSLTAPPPVPNDAGSDLLSRRYGRGNRGHAYEKFTRL